MKLAGNKFTIACCVFGGILATALSAASASPQVSRAASAGFDAYVRKVEARLDKQHRSTAGFLAALAQDKERELQDGHAIVEQLTPEDGMELPGALIHHWRGTAFIPGATATEFDHLLRDLPAYPRVFAPQVIRAAVASGSGDRVQTRMRIVQHHGLTVVIDTEYDVSFGQLNPDDRWSTSHSTRISEVENAGTPHERDLSPTEDHGFLWRLDTWWSYQQRDGGLYIQMESVSLTRSIPSGLGWAVRPFAESIPRESLEFTLHAASNALHNQEGSSR